MGQKIILIMIKSSQELFFTIDILLIVIYFINSYLFLLFILLLFYFFIFYLFIIFIIFIIFIKKKKKNKIKLPQIKIN